MAAALILFLIVLLPFFLHYGFYLRWFEELSPEAKKGFGCLAGIEGFLVLLLVGLGFVLDCLGSPESCSCSVLATTCSTQGCSLATCDTVGARPLSGTLSLLITCWPH